MFYSLAYESQASVPLTAPDLLELLDWSRGKNARLGVTGVLLYRHGTFLQVLEGPHAQVDDLYATIARDPRHHSVSTLLAEERSARRFPDWTMGFADVAGELGEVDGYNDVLNAAQGPGGEESAEFLELLSLFASEEPDAD